MVKVKDKLLGYGQVSRLFKLSPGSESYHILLRQDIKVIGSKDIRDSVKTPTVHIGKTFSNFCQLRLITL